MNIPFRIFSSFILFSMLLSGCGSTPNNTSQTETKKVIDSAVNTSEYKEFSEKFQKHNLPLSLPNGSKENKATELDKKYINDLFSDNFTPAFGKEDVLPKISEDLSKSKYLAEAKLKLDSFDGYIIHKQDDDDYYFLCIFDKKGRFTDGTWIAFTEGSDDDGTIREASINDDGSIEISQYNILKGKADRAGAERHFYEITPQGKIRDLKDNSTPGNA